MKGTRRGLLGGRLGAGWLGCLAALFATAWPAVAHEWYIPKRTDVIRPLRLELGLRGEFVARDHSSLETQHLNLVPSLRFSPYQNFETYVETPYVFAWSKRNADDGRERERRSDIGDVFTQFTYKVPLGRGRALLPSLDVTLPTGRDPYDRDAGTGSGHRSYTPGLTAVQSMDPLVLFAYAGYQYSEQRTFDVGRVKPGDSLRILAGASFQANRRVRFTGFTATDIRERTTIAGERMEDSGGNAVRVGARMDWIFSPQLDLNFNAVFGTTDLAPDLVLTGGIVYKFGGQ